MAATSASRKQKWLGSRAYTNCINIVSKEKDVKVYKFKDLTDDQKHCHFVQIVLEKHIWCARPDSLNDEDEFKFILDYKPSPRTFHLLAKALAQYGTTHYCPPYISAYLTLKNDRLECIAAPIIADVVKKCRTTIGITSFSITKTDLWKEYGGKGNGVCVEINIPDQLVGQSYHLVSYIPKVFHVDSFLESALFPDKAFETYRNILLTKTEKWEKEQEMRFIGNRQDVNLIFDGHISKVTFGPNVPSHTLENLLAHIANHCSCNNIRITKLS